MVQLIFIFIALCFCFYGIIYYTDKLSDKIFGGIITIFVSILFGAVLIMVLNTVISDKDLVKRGLAEYNKQTGKLEYVGALKGIDKE